MKTYKVIGVMSGTSLDGLDLAYCEFRFENEKWFYEIKAAETIPYDQKWLVRLTELPKQPIHLYPKTDAFYGKYIGMQVRAFMKKNEIKGIDLIASHGHTIFHQPEAGFTAQIGSGAAIYAETNIPTVSDFRTVDVALGGQGAPLVPIGDELLFSDYNACVNLGGFANVSYVKGNERVAFDVCACNLLLNQVARQAGKEYDEDGVMASEGEVVPALFDELNALPFYAQQGAKSLGREWVEAEIWPLVGKHSITLEDLLATFVEHIAIQLANVLKNSGSDTVLLTGGGALNTYLVGRIDSLSKCKLVPATTQLIQYKEALIFAFLGLLRIQQKSNSLASVTGAKRGSIGGALWG